MNGETLPAFDAIAGDVCRELRVNLDFILAPGKVPHVVQARRVLIRRLMEHGYTYAAIGRAMNWREQDVRYCVLERRTNKNAAPSRRNDLWTDADKNTAATKHLAGVSYNDIARELNRSPGAVKMMLKTLDLASYRENKAPAVDDLDLAHKLHVQAVLKVCRQGFANPIAVARADNENEIARRPALICDPTGGFLAVRSFA